MGTALNQYALYFGLALILLVAASAAGIVLRKRGLGKGRAKDKSNVEFADFERGIEDLRREFRHSNDAAQAATRRATTIGENLISIIKPIESSLRDLNARIIRVEQQGSETAAVVPGLQKLLSEDNGRIAIQTEASQQRLMALTDQLSLLEQMIQEVKVRGESNDNATIVINAGLADIQRQIDVLIPRLEFGERARTDLSTLHDSFAQTLNALTASSDQIAQRIADLEQRLQLTDAAFEARLGSMRAPENPSVTETLHQRVVALTDQLSLLEQTIQGIKVRDESNDNATVTINVRLADIQRQIDGLIPRLEFGERERADLSTLHVSLAELLQKQTTSSDQIAQQIIALEQRFRAKVAEFEARLGSIRAPDNPGATADINDTREEAGPGGAEEAYTNITDTSSDDGAGKPRPPHKPTISGEGNATDDPRPHVAPEARGGGSRTERKTNGQVEPPPAMASLLTPELIATRGSGDWQIFVEVDGTDSSKLDVVQGNASLPRGSDAFQFGPLRDLTTPLQIHLDGAEATERILATAADPILYFRFRNDFCQEVRRPTRGLNLAVVPSQWQYDEARSGIPPIEPESIDAPGYRVHFLSVDKSPLIAFDRPDEGPFFVKLSKPRFRLTGHCLSDAEEKMGPLFAGEPPTLDLDNYDDLAKVRAIVFGVEGRGPGRWRGKWKANGDWSESWQEQVRKHGSGWYFVRLYNERDDLIDSLDFRYVGGLKDVNNECADTKSRLERESISLKFVHDENVSVDIADAAPQLQGPIVRGPPTTAFAWPIDPNIRKAIFVVRDRGSEVRATFDTDRIWWSLANGSAASSPSWQLSPLELKPDDFGAVSNTVVSFRFPSSSSLEALVGFEYGDRRALLIRVDGQAALDLNTFSEVPNLANFGIQTLRLWIREGDNEFDLAVAHINNSKKCRWCDVWLSGPEEMSDHVLTQHHDRCFERLELKGEGMAQAILVCLAPSCGQYYPESFLPGEYAVDRLNRHANLRHPHTMAYKRIDNPQDIRNLLGLKEKWVWKCKLDNCRPITPSPSDQDALQDKKEHLVQEHLSELFACSETGK